MLVVLSIGFSSAYFDSPEDEWWMWGKDTGYSRYTNANGPLNISNTTVVTKTLTRDVDNSPIVVGDSVFVVADSYYSSKAYELNATNISQVLQESSNSYDVLHSFSYSDGFLYHKSDYYLYQVNASNLSQVVDSEYIADSAGWNGPPTVLDGRVYAAAGNYNPYSKIFNASNISQTLSSRYVYSRPYEAVVVSGDYAYSSFTGTVLQLNATNFTHLISSVSCSANSIADNPTVKNGFLYKTCLVNGSTGLVQFNASDVSQEIANFSAGYRSYAVSDDYVYFGDGAYFYQLNASNVSQQVANYSTGAYAGTVPVVNDDYVYFSIGSVMYQFDANNVSNLIGTYSAGSTIYGDPIIAKGFLYFGSVDDKLYQLGTYNPVHSVEIDYPVDNGVYVSVDSLNYSVGGVGWEKCWYSLDSGLTNSSVVNAGEDFGGLTNFSLWNNWSVYCNDSLGVVYDESSSFYVDVDYPVFGLVESQSVGESEALSYYVDATDGGGVSCFSVSSSNFSINCSGYLTNESVLAIGNYSLNISVNDSIGRESFTLFGLEVTANPAIGLEVIFPSGDINVTRNEFFEVRVNVTCLISNCGEINVTLDPEEKSEVDDGFEFVAMSVINLYDNKSFLYDIQDGCDMSDAQADVFDGGLKMYIDNSEYTGIRSSTEDSGREAVCDWQSKSLLNVSRKVYVPADQNWARYLEILNNPTDSEVCVDVKIYQNMGSDGSDFINTSSGDSTWNSTDYWMMWDDSSSTSGDDAAGFVYHQDGAEEVVDVFTRSSGANQWVWENVCIGAGETEALMHFFTQWDTRLQSETESDFIYENFNDDVHLANLSDLELASIVNWEVSSVKGGTVSMVEGDTPFYTNVTNPYNLSLSFGESRVVSWFVNATGDLNTTHEFFVYANKSSMLGIGNMSERWNVTIVNFSVDNDAPVVVLNSPLDNFGAGQNVSLGFNVSDVSNVSNCSLVLNDEVNLTNDSVGGLYQIFELEDLNVGGYTWRVRCVDEFGNLGDSEVRSFSVIIKGSFSGNSTNLSAVDVSNISNFVIDEPTYGKINWSSFVDLSLGGDIDSYVNISFNRIEVNSSVLSSLNKSAELMLYGLTFDDPEILRDGVICSSDVCSEVGYSDGTLIFNVTGFSVYSARENSSGEVISPIPSSSGGGGSNGGSRVIFVPECSLNSDCGDGFSCYEGICVKLFDVEILDVVSFVENLSFDLDYFVKGMADINNDVVIEFWLERDSDKIELGKDTIYLGSFEERVKGTTLNLPHDIEDGSYDLYVSSSFERYTAKSFRKINVEIPERVKKEAALVVGEDNGFYLGVIGFLLIVIAFLLFHNKTRNGIFRKVRKVRRKVKSKGMAAHVDNEMVGQWETSFISDQVFEDFERSDVDKKERVETLLPRETFGLRELYGKDVYSGSGNLVGKVRRAILAEGKIHGWVIFPDRKYHRNKDIFVKHNCVESIGEIFLISEGAEKHLFLREGFSFKRFLDILKRK